MLSLLAERKYLLPFLQMWMKWVVLNAVVSNLIIVVWRCVDDMPASGVED